MPQSRILVLPLLKRYKASTDGTTNPVDYDLEVPEFTNILPYAESLTLLTLTEGAPAPDFEWNVGFLSGFDRSHHGSFTAIVTSNITANGSARSSAYTTVANFNLDSRLQLRVKGASSGVKSATLSAVLLVQLIGV